MRADFSNKSGNSIFGKKKGGIKFLKEKIIAFSVVLVVLGLVVYFVWPESKKKAEVKPPVEQTKQDSPDAKVGGSAKDNDPTNPKNGLKEQNGNATNQNLGQSTDGGGNNDKHAKPPGKNNSATKEITASPATTQTTAKADYNSFKLNMIAANGSTQFYCPGMDNGENLEYQFEVKCSGNCEGNDFSYSSERLSENSVNLDLRTQLKKINNERKFKAEVKIYGSDGKLKKTLSKENISLQCNPK